VPEREWQVDLEKVEPLIDARTRAFLVVNPSNPCGTVFSKEHQLEIIALARKHKLPLFCDEVYYGLVFPGREFESFPNLAADVPMICVNSLSKVYQVPGWRLGWIIVYNRHGYLDIVREHILNYLRIPFHPCSLVMHALPKILKETPDSYLGEYAAQLAKSSNYVYEQLKAVRGVTPIQASAGMYMMVKLHYELFKPDSGISDDKAFVLKLWEDESVLLLPSECFFQKGFFRVVTCISEANADEFAARLTRFLSNHLLK